MKLGDLSQRQVASLAQSLIAIDCKVRAAVVHSSFFPGLTLLIDGIIENQALPIYGLDQCREWEVMAWMRSHLPFTEDEIERWLVGDEGDF